MFCLLGLFLSFEVSDSESSAVLKGGVLDGDEFPAFFAEVVQVVLDVVDYWSACAVGVVCVDSCFYGGNFVFPLWRLGHFRVRRGLRFRKCSLLVWFFRL